MFLCIFQTQCLLIVVMSCVIFILIRLHWLNWLNEVEYYGKHFYLFTLWLYCLLHASTDKYISFELFFLLFCSPGWTRRSGDDEDASFSRPVGHPILFFSPRSIPELMLCKSVQLEWDKKTRGTKEKHFVVIICVPWRFDDVRLFGTTLSRMKLSRKEGKKKRIFFFVSHRLSGCCGVYIWLFNLILFFDTLFQPDCKTTWIPYLSQYKYLLLLVF